MEPETNFLRQITLELASESKLEELLDLILAYANNLVPFSSVNLCLLEAERLKVVHIKGYEGTDLDIPEIERMYEEATIPDIREMQKNPEPVIIRKSNRAPEWIDFEKSKWVLAYLGLPVIANGRVIGLIGFDSDKEDVFTNRTIHIDNQITPIHLPPRLVVSLGLLVNELAVNAVKYAFVTPGEHRFFIDLAPTGKNAGNPLLYKIRQSEV